LWFSLRIYLHQRLLFSLHLFVFGVELRKMFYVREISTSRSFFFAQFYNQGNNNFNQSNHIDSWISIKFFQLNSILWT
jgi:hypothetical protein